MYVSIRDFHLPGLFGNIKSGLDALGMNSVELVYDRDKTVFSLDGTAGTKTSLATQADLDSFAYKLSGFKIKVSALLLANDFSADDLQKELEWVVSSLHAAHRFGAKAVRIDAHMSKEGEWPIEKRIQHFADCMAQILDATKDLDVSMGIENHGQKGNEQEFLDTVLNKVNSPRLGLTVDTANFYWYGYPIKRVHEIIKHFAPRVKHTHLKSIHYPADKRDIQREIGWAYDEYASGLREGDIDIDFIIKTLKTAGYRGDLCIENEGLGHYDIEGQKSALKDDAAYLRELIAKEKAS